MIRVALVCSGLGNVSRGFESFTSECFEAISGSLDFDVQLYKGAGDASAHEHVVPNLSRNGVCAKTLARIFQKDSYYLEQATFGFRFLPILERYRPNVIFFSDGTIGNLLWRWRNIRRLPFKLLFSNGGPLQPPFDRWDHVQQLTPAQYQHALACGERPEKQTLLPYGLRIGEAPSADQWGLRQRLGLPTDVPIMLSVGALNQSHKRMDYVIQEIAALGESRPFLLLLGERDAESDGINKLAHDMLGTRFDIRTVSMHEVGDYYRAADAFTLCSLSEGLPRAILEAFARGTRCFVHDYDVTRYILQDFGTLLDLSKVGSLTNALSQVSTLRNTLDQSRAQYHSAYERFSWETLRAQYIEMIKKVALQANSSEALQCQA